MIISCKEDLQLAYDFINKYDTLAFDTETTGLNWRKDLIIGFSFATPDEAVYVAHLAWDGHQLNELISKEECTKLLRTAIGKRLTGWNLKFDMQFTLSYFGVDLITSIWSDGMLAKHAVEEDALFFGLKETAASVFGIETNKEKEEMLQSIKENGGTAKEYYKASLPTIAKYCMQDSKLSYKLNARYVTQLQAEGLHEFYFNDETMPLYREVTIPMEMRGIRVDIDALRSTKEQITHELSSLENKIQTLAAPHTGKFNTWFLEKNYPVRRTGPFVQVLAETLKIALPLTPGGKFSTASEAILSLPERCQFRRFMEGRDTLHPSIVKVVQKKMHGPSPMLNLSSKHHLKKIFFDELCEVPLSTTDKGSPQIDETFLESVKRKHPFVPLLIEYNKLVKIKGAYIDRLIEENEESRWHPSFQQHRTISGRYGSDAQQFPKAIEDDEIERGESTPLIQRFTNLIRTFLISSEGCLLTGADYESLEPKIFAHVSGDENLKNIFKLNHDFYSTIAIRTEGLDASPDKKNPLYLGKINKTARQRAKAYALGIAYGMTGYKLKFQLECEQEEADKLVADYLVAFPALAEWIHNTHVLVKSKGISFSETGRVRHMPYAAYLHARHGDQLLDSLWLWKTYNAEGPLYAEMKKKRAQFKNFLNNGCNFQIQSLAASIVNRACIAINREFKKHNLSALIILQVHDEIVVEHAEGEKEIVHEIMRRIMETNYKISVPLVADPQSGVKYSETKA